MGQLDLADGVHAVVDILLPGDGQDGIIQIVGDLSALCDLHIGGKQGILPRQELLGILQQPAQGAGVRGLAEFGLVGLRSHLVVVAEPVDPLDDHNAVQSLTDPVGHVHIVAVHDGQVHGIGPHGALRGAGELEHEQHQSADDAQAGSAHDNALR